MVAQNVKGMADLQAVMAMARKKNPALSRTYAEPAKPSSALKTGQVMRNAGDISVESNKLVDIFYSKSPNSQEVPVNLVGSRFDAYA